jgi:alpha-tubulin suppressor-like RCC1 family protein
MDKLLEKQKSVTQDVTSNWQSISNGLSHSVAVK